MDYAEIYVNDILVDTVELPSSSNYYFEYERDTSELPDGEYTITVTVYDCSGNSFSKSVSVTVLNEPTMQSCKLTKLNVIGQLEEVRTGDKKLDGLLEAAILNIKESLDEELWNGDYQLNPKFGHKVPVREKSAVMNLWQLYRNKAADDGVKQACYNAVVALLACDHQLARTVYNEAKKYAGDAKVDRELCSAESAFDAAIEVLTDEDQKPEIKAFKAIDLYKRAMEHSETAIVFGIK